MKMDDGSVQAVVELDDGHYYQILSEYVGMPIEGRVPADADLEAVGVDAERV